MTDNDLIRLFLPIINNGLLAGGFTGVKTQQSYQPTQQGVNTSPTLFFYKVGDYRYGFPSRKDVWDDIGNVMIHTETQQYETTFQVSALVIQDPNNTNSYTASDLLNYVAYIMQSQSTVEQLIQQNVNVLRVTSIRNPYFSDDMHRWEANPSFDFVLTHLQTITSTVPSTNIIESGIYPV